MPEASTYMRLDGSSPGIINTWRFNFTTLEKYLSVVTLISIIVIISLAVSLGKANARNNAMTTTLAPVTTTSESKPTEPPTKQTEATTTPTKSPTTAETSTKATSETTPTTSSTKEPDTTTVLTTQTHNVTVGPHGVNSVTNSENPKKDSGSVYVRFSKSTTQNKATTQYPKTNEKVGTGTDKKVKDDKVFVKLSKVPEPEGVRTMAQKKTVKKDSAIADKTFGEDYVTKTTVVAKKFEDNDKKFETKKVKDDAKEEGTTTAKDLLVGDKKYNAQDDVKKQVKTVAQDLLMVNSKIKKMIKKEESELKKDGKQEEESTSPQETQEDGAKGNTHLKFTTTKHTIPIETVTESIKMHVKNVVH